VLGVAWRVLGLAGGVAAALAGICGMVLGEGGPLEAAGAGTAALGGLMAVAAFRCRRWTVSVGREWVRSDLGPFVRILPRRGIVSLAIHPATGVRRLYAREEVELSLAAGDHRFRIPSADPGTLAEVLGHPAGPPAS